MENFEYKQLDKNKIYFFLTTRTKNTRTRLVRLTCTNLSILDCTNLSILDWTLLISF